MVEHNELMMFAFQNVTLRLVHICTRVSMQGTTLVLGLRMTHVWSQSCQGRTPENSKVSV